MVLNYLNEIKSSDDGYSYFDNYNSTNRHLFNQRVKFERLEKSKKCALKAVDEIFEFMRMDDLHSGTASNANSIWVKYWIEVKKEIELL